MQDCTFPLENVRILEIFVLFESNYSITLNKSNEYSKEGGKKDPVILGLIRLFHPPGNNLSA